MLYRHVSLCAVAYAYGSLFSHPIKIMGIILCTFYMPRSFETASVAHLQVFFDLMREIRSRKIEDKSASNGRGKDRAKRKKKKCIIL